MNLVNKCGDCPWATNNRAEHDDPFTSSPAHYIDLCGYVDNEQYFIINLENLSDECIHPLWRNK